MTQPTDQAAAKSLETLPASPTFLSSFKAYGDRRALIMLFLGFSAGIPILLIFSSLSLWLREAGLDRSVVTLFSWAALGYSFKFVWAPLVDAMPVPWLGKILGRRRSWLLIAQLMVIAAIAGMALVNPVTPEALTFMAAAAVLLGFSSATQDIVIDAYRIELAPADLQSVLAATYNAGYRIGMIVAGAGALYLAQIFGSTAESYSYDAWKLTYLIMAGVMGIGVLTTLIIREPVTGVIEPKPVTAYARLVLLFLISVAAFVIGYRVFGSTLTKPTDAPLLSFLFETCRLGSATTVAGLTGYLLTLTGLVDKEVARQTWVTPITDFFARYGSSALLLLLLIGTYRISDIVAGVISNVFYQDMGFSKIEIANAVKLFGVIMTIAGGFLGGLLALRFKIMPAMMLGAVLASATNLLFILLLQNSDSIFYLYLAVTMDNLASGLAGAVFIAFLSALTNIRFTAVQYALFSSLMTLIPKVTGGYSGSIVDAFGYAPFFWFTTLLGLPVLLLVYLVHKKNLVN